MQWQKTEADDDELAGDESCEPSSRCVHKTIRVQADTEHVDAKPGEAGHDISEDGQIDQAALAHDSAPARVENQSIPQNNQQGAVFFRVPAPKAAPGLIGPDTPKDSSNKAEKGGKTDNCIDHLGQGFAKRSLANRFGEQRCPQAKDNEGNSEQAC